MEIAGILSGEAGLAGIQELLHGAATQQLLCAEVTRLLSATATVQSCTLLRAKIKPRSKITAYYTLSLVDRSSGHAAQRAMAVTWSAASAAHQTMPSKEEEATLALEATALATGVAAPFRQLHALAPHGQMHLQISPLDAQFPHLLTAVAPSWVAQLLGEAAGAPAYGVTTVRYRPRQRHVLYYSPRSQQNEQSLCGHFYAKLYQSGSSQSIGDVAAWVQRQLAAGASQVRALTPAAWVAEQQLALYAAMAGQPLSNLLMTQGAPPKLLPRAGAALRALHDAPTHELPSLPCQTFDDEIKAIRRAGAHLTVLAPHLYGRLQRLLERAAARQADLAPPECTFTHRDFKADHLLVNSEELVLIDFDSCALGDPALDLGKFLADLYWWQHLGGNFERQGAEQAFLAGYGAAAGSDRLLRVRHYTVLWLVKNCLRRFNQFGPQWLEQNEALFKRIEEVEAQLRGAIEA